MGNVRELVSSKLKNLDFLNFFSHAKLFTTLFGFKVFLRKKVFIKGKLTQTTGTAVFYKICLSYKLEFVVMHFEILTVFILKSFTFALP